MVNTTSKIKRKSDYNRTRLSRRVKRGGAWLNNDTILNETQYFEKYKELRETYNLSDEDINTNKFPINNDSERQKILDLLDRLNKYKQKRLHVYKELLKECVPVYPYARVETDADRASIEYKKQEAERHRKRITYLEKDYNGPVSIVSTGYGPAYML
jgi:hypothetical protein